MSVVAAGAPGCWRAPWAVGELEAVLLRDQRHALDVHTQGLRCHAGHDALSCFGAYGWCELAAFFPQAFVMCRGAIVGTVNTNAVGMTWVVLPEPKKAFNCWFSSSMIEHPGSGIGSPIMAVHRSRRTTQAAPRNQPSSAPFAIRSASTWPWLH